MKIFKLKKVPAPWQGPDKTVTRVDLENALRSFPNPHPTQGYVDRFGVFIGASDQNMPTYVLVESETGPWKSGETRVHLWSVNGMGECRWTEGPNNLGQSGKQAVQAYGLTDAANDEPLNR